MLGILIFVMFTIDPKISDLKVKEKNILKILFSMNIHQVASPEMILEEARSYVLFFREGKARISAYIALHLLTTDRKLYYSHSSNPFPEDELSAVEEEALGFAEGLGALLDAKDFTNMSDSEQDRWIDDQDIFAKKPLSETRSAPKSVAPPIQPGSPPAQPAPQTPSTPAPQAQQAQPTQSAPAPEPAPVAHTPQPPVKKQPEISAAGAPQKATPTGDSSSQVKSAPLAAAKQQELMQQAIKAGIAKTPKQSSIKHAQPAAGVVSRDREALARLLASF